MRNKAVKKVLALILTVCLTFALVPLSASAQEASLGISGGVEPQAIATATARAIVGYSYLYVRLTEGAFAPNPAPNHNAWTISVPTGMSIQGISRVSNTMVSFNLSADVSASDTFTITGVNASQFAAGTDPFATPLNVEVKTPAPAQGGATAAAGARDILVTLTKGEFNPTQLVSYWTLGGASAGSYSVSSVSYIDVNNVKITLNKDIGASDVLTVTSTAGAFLDASTGLFASARPVTIAPSAAAGCEIGSQWYPNLDEALEEVLNGETIRLLGDITHESGIVLRDKSFIIDVNDSTLTVKTVDESGIHLTFGYSLSVVDNAAAKAGGLIVEASGERLSGLYANGNGSKISIEVPATVTVRADNSNGVFASSGGEVYLNGDVSIDGDDRSHGAYAESSLQGGIITIDGTISALGDADMIRVNLAQFSDLTQGVPGERTGYLAFRSPGDTADPKSTVWVKDAGASTGDVCQIGEQGFATLDLALAAVTDSTPTAIDILTNIDHTKAVQLINRNITLNLSGHTVTISTTETAVTALIVNGGSLNLTDGGALNISGKSHGVHVQNGGVATVTNAKVSNPALSSGNAADADTGGVLMVLGDAIAEGDHDTAVLAGSGGSVTVNGDARAVKTAAYAGPIIGGSPKPTVYIKGDAIVTGTHVDSAGAFAFGGGEITIDGEIIVADQNKYIRLNNAYKTKAETSGTPVKAGYLTYSDGTGTYNNTVWVKDPSAAPLPAYTVTVGAATSSPVAGAANAITLTVKNSLGEPDTAFTGQHTVTLSGAQATVGGGYGFFYSYGIEAGGTLTKPMTFTNGVATADLSLFKAGAQTISFSVADVTNPSASVSLTVTPRPPAGLRLAQDITAPAANGGPFARQPVVELIDDYANLCTNDSTTQINAAKFDSGDWTLTGTDRVTAANGVAAFTDLAAVNAAQVTGAKLRFACAGPIDMIFSEEVTLPAPAGPADVCKIVDKGYATLGEAITDALNAGGATTITLLQSINEAAPIAVESAAIAFALGDFDLTIDTSAENGSTALYVSSGGQVTYTGSGAFKVIGDFSSVRADGTNSQAKVTYAEATRDSAYNVQAGSGGKVYVAGGVLCRGDGSHALRATLGGVITVDGTVTCLGKNSLGAYSSGTGSDITVNQGVTADKVDSDGVDANSGGHASITGNVTAGETGVTVYGSSNSRVEVTGSVTTLGLNPEAYAEGVSAGGYGTVTVTGSVTARGVMSIGVSSNGSTVTVGGSVTSDNVGASATNGGKITIDGVITAGGSYVMVGNVPRTIDGNEDISSIPDYKEYTDGTNTVWVKGTPQLGTPTGLAWDTSGGELKATWTAVTNADQYEVKYYKDGALLGISTTVSAPDTFTDDMKDNLLLAWGTGSYTFTVQATASSGGNFLDSEISQPSAPYMHGVTAYTVTVSGSYASPTGAGSYAPGSTVNIHAGSRPGYTFVGWTSGHDVAIINAGSADASFTMPGYAVTVTANWRYSGGGGSTAVSAQVTPKEAVFDKDPAHVNHRDVAVTLSSGSYYLSGILLNGKALQKDVDYTVSGGTVTIKKDLLAALEEGSHPFTFDMSGGADPVLTVTVTGKASPGIPFEDVRAGDWFAADVMWAFEAGLMQGVSETPMLFAPHGDTTRGMIAAILYRLEGAPASDGANFFSDVPAGAWYAAAVDWAAEKQIVKGYGDGRFGPEDPITREQLAAILYRYAGFKGYDVDLRTDLTLFTDGDSISGWAQEAVSWAVATGLLEGDGEMLTPRSPAQRCQAATILRRFARDIAA